MKNRTDKYHILCALILMFILAGCQVRRPKGVIPESKMENLLYDYHIAKALGENLPYNENYKKALYIEYVFRKHNTTETVFDSSMVWYTRHADVLSKIYERVGKRLRAGQNEIDNLVAVRDRKPKISAPGDSVDLWLSDRMILLTGNPLNNKLTFAIPSDSNFKARDTIQWSMCCFFPGARPDSAGPALMSMAIRYANDSVISKINRVYESGLQTIRLQADTLGDIKEVRGYVYYSGRKDSVEHLLANHISLMRYHSNDSLFSEKADTLETKNDTPETASEKIEGKQAEEQVQPLPERVNPAEPKRKGERPRPARRSETVKEVSETVKEVIE
ncbi:MAG: DUF4296 domain-containing protein [Mediterranea sp.]|jgi:hypothetical protein|nr:DUF4296 domain-containing protein [Mediterranea sp.]